MDAEDLKIVFKSNPVKRDLKETFENRRSGRVPTCRKACLRRFPPVSVRVYDRAVPAHERLARVGFGRAAAPLVAALAAALACGKEELPPPPAGISLTLLESGREPRRLLRYPASPTAAHRVSLTLRLAMKMEVPGSPVPPVTMPGLRLLLDIVSARGERHVKYDFTVSDADLTGTDNAHPSLLAEMRKGVAQLIGVTGHLRVDARGFASDLSLALPAGIGQELSQFMNSARLAIGQMVVPLPAEPIGIGAKWEAAETIQQDGMSVRERTHYELIALDGPRALIRTQTGQSADKQRAALPGLPDGVSAEVVSLRGSGSGETEVDLRRLAPGSAREEVKTDVSFVVRQGQTERAMSLTATSGLEIQAL